MSTFANIPVRANRPERVRDALRGIVGRIGELFPPRGGFHLPQYTTTARDAITTWVDGDMIWNSTLGKQQNREAGAWVTK